MHSGRELDLLFELMMKVSRKIKIVLFDQKYDLGF